MMKRGAAWIAVVGWLWVIVASHEAGAEESMPGAHDMVLSVMDGGSGEKLSGVVVEVKALWADRPVPVVPAGSCMVLPKHGLKGDGEGRVVVPLTKYRLGVVWVTVKREGYAARELEWGGNPDPRRFPAERVVKMDRARVIGGVVRDEAGKAVAGAPVRVSRYAAMTQEVPGFIEENVLEGSAVTDEKGRWKLEGAPPVVERAIVEVDHAEYLPGRLEEGQVAKLLAGEAEVVVKRGASVGGAVVNKEGMPVSGAVVRYAMGSSANAPEARTGEDGRFRLARLPGRGAMLEVRAEGYGPVMETLDPEQGKEARFVLAPARVIRGVVVDSKGKAVKGANVSVRGWGGRSVFGFMSAQTDDEGKFAIEGSEGTRVGVQVSHREHMSVWDRVLDPGKEGVERIVMLRPLRVRGTVMDEGTEKPVKSFRVVTGWGQQGLGGWDTNFAKEGFDGKYDVTITHPRDVYRVRVEAEGYAAAVGPEIRYGVENDGETVVFDAVMRRAKELAGVIVGRDGTAVAGADVVLATADTQTMLHNMRPSERQNFSKRVRTGEDGRFAFPAVGVEGEYELLVMHDDGYAKVTPGEMAKGETVTLMPWGRIEGKIMLGKTAGKGETAMIMGGPPERNGPRVHQSWEAKADEEGRFVIERLPAGTYYLGRVVKIERGGGSSYTLTNGKHVAVTSGAAAAVTIGGTGRAVVGRIKVGDGVPETWQSAFLRMSEPLPDFARAPVSAGWEKMSVEERRAANEAWRKSDEGKAFLAKYDEFEKRKRSFAFDVAPGDLEFRVEDVEAGTYEISGSVNGEAKEARRAFGDVVAMVTKTVVVPEGTGEFDVGEVEMVKFDMAERRAAATRAVTRPAAGPAGK